MSGRATAIIVEFSGMSVAASPAATRRIPALGSVASGTGDRTSLQEVQVVDTEGELDVVVGGAEDLVARGREGIERRQSWLVEAEDVHQVGPHGNLLGGLGAAAGGTDGDVLVAERALELTTAAGDAVAVGCHQAGDDGLAETPGRLDHALVGTGDGV